MVNSRAKGARGEREAAAKLTEWTGIQWRRGISQSRHGGAEGADVEPESDHVVWSRLHVEVKRGKRIDVPAAMQQARRDASARTYEGRPLIPVVLYRADHKKWTVQIEVGALFELAGVAPELTALHFPMAPASMLAHYFFRNF